MGRTPRKVKERPGSKEEAIFARSRHEELDDLMRNGTFRPMKQSDVPAGAHILGARFVDELKKAGEGLRKKSRFVSQSYADEQAATIATKAPIVQRYSQRTALSVAASTPDLDPFLRDIVQASIQSLSALERRIFIKAPKELGLPDGYVLEVIKPLYGIPESGLHWYLTYMSHHVEELGRRRSRVDPCVLLRRDEERLRGMILLQVDDTLGLWYGTFLADEEEASARFNSKPRAPLTTKPTTFNGITIP